MGRCERIRILCIIHCSVNASIPLLGVRLGEGSDPVHDDRWPSWGAFNIDPDVCASTKLGYPYCNSFTYSHFRVLFIACVNRSNHHSATWLAG